MNRIAVCLIGFVGALFIVLAPAPAHAICVCTCTTHVDPVAFGNVNPVTAGNTDTTADVTVTCGPLGVVVSYDIKLSRGGGSTYATRQMLSGANTLPYNLYRDSGRTQIWGDGTGGSNFVSNGFLVGVGATTKSDRIYARIPPTPTARAGAYTDTIVATVVY